MHSQYSQSHTQIQREQDRAAALERTLEASTRGSSNESTLTHSGPTLSIFNAPTATYAWPNLEASNSMSHGSSLFVDYHHSRRRTDTTTAPPPAPSSLISLAEASQRSSSPEHTAPEPDWEIHTQKVKDLDGTSLFRCVWASDPERPCNYVAKKQLVKRHVLATHLRHKPYLCTFPGCDKAFSQRTSRDTHAFGHTKEKPHKCHYPNCDQAFSDPARRHKHMVDAHDYTPGRRVVKEYDIVEEERLEDEKEVWVREKIYKRKQRVSSMREQ